MLRLSLAGCGDPTPPSAESAARLTYKGQPIPQVYLRFEPDDLTTKATSMAVTDANGKFEMAIGSTPGVFRGKVKVFCDDPLAAMGAKTARSPRRSNPPTASSAPNTAPANRRTSSRSISPNRI